MEVTQEVEVTCPLRWIEKLDLLITKLRFVNKERSDIELHEDIDVIASQLYELELDMTTDFSTDVTVEVEPEDMSWRD